MRAPVMWNLALGLCVVGCGGSGCPGPFGNNNGDNPCDSTRNESRNNADGGHAQCSVLPDFGLTCQEEFSQAGATDIIWVADNSGSMGDEIEGVRANIAQFAEVMTNSGVDFHLIMVSNQTGGANPVCVPEPLATSGCDSNGHFLRVEAEVQSNDGPDVLLEQYDGRNGGFAGFMRPGSKRSIVFLTDDDYLGGTADTFLNAINSRDGLRGAVVHAIVGTSFEQCPQIAAKGTAYLNMAERTGGLVVPICCNDYNKVINTLATDIALAQGRYMLERAAVPNSVHVFFMDSAVDAGSTTRTPVRTGWSYDATLHAVEFEAASRPPTGTLVLVTYAVQ